jgi:hypothetical protein
MFFRFSRALSLSCILLASGAFAQVRPGGGPTPSTSRFAHYVDAQHTSNAGNHRARQGGVAGRRGYH